MMPAIENIKVAKEKLQDALKAYDLIYITLIFLPSSKQEFITVLNAFNCVIIAIVVVYKL